MDSSTVSTYNTIAKEFSNSRHYKWSWITDFYNDYIYCLTENNSAILKITGLDIGCGNGRNIENYQTENVNIIGIDNSIEFIKICKDKHLNCREMDMCNLIFNDESVDFITVIASFHHLDTIDKRLDCLNEIYRVLRKTGKVLISVWSKSQPKKTKRIFKNYGNNIVPWKSKNGKTYNRYYYIFKIDELCDLIFKAGFKIQSKKWDCGNEILICEK